jgi:uncharacterized membrane protein YadS
VPEHPLQRQIADALRALATVVGTAVRATWSPARRWFAGINFSAKTLLETMVLLLGSSISG